MSTRASNSNSVPTISQVKTSKRRTEVNMFVQDAQKGWALLLIREIQISVPVWCTRSVHGRDFITLQDGIRS